MAKQNQSSKTLSSPNRMVRAYASIARALAQQAKSAVIHDDVRQAAAASIIMAVASVETYLNIMARLWIEQDEEFEFRERVDRDLASKRALGRKLEEWPELFFKKRLNFGGGPAQRFKETLDLRNQLMHFSSDAHEYEFENIKIKGLINTDAYDSLDASLAEKSVKSATDFISHLIELQGIPPEQMVHAMHHWVGTPATA